MENLKVVFVGSFAGAAGDGTVGGQMSACNTILRNSDTARVEWFLIDSTMKSHPPPNIVARIVLAFRRIGKLLLLLTFRGVDAVWVFSSFDALSFLEKGLMCILGRAFRKRVVLSIRSEIVSVSTGTLLTWIRCRILRWCSLILCQSKEAQNSLILQFRLEPQKLEVIPNWIDVRIYRRVATNSNSNQNNRRPRFVFLGWIEPYKGVIDLIEACRLLIEEGLEFEVSICGGGKALREVADLCRLYSLQEVIRLHGWVVESDKVTILWESDIMVLPSYSEGLPNALLEGMSAGLAIIATKVGGIPSLIKSNEFGRLVDAGDILALSAAMKEFILFPDRVRKIGMHNAEYVGLNHDIREVWPTIEKLLRGTL